MDHLSGEAEFSLSDGVPNSSDLPGELTESPARNQSKLRGLAHRTEKISARGFRPCGVFGSTAQINFEGTLRVDGYMAGVICSDAGTLILDQNGEIDGDIVVPVAIIRGRLRGDIRASERVTLEPAARVIGDIETLELLVHPGAEFEGRCQFPESAAVKPEPAFAEIDQPEASFAAAG